MAPPTLVLCYHAVSDEWTDPLGVPAGAIARQIRWLLRLGYRGATAQEALATRRGALHVTFDDAYRSVRDALPALRALEVPVTVFACTSYADDGRPLDVPELRGRDGGRPGELATMTWEMLAEASAGGVTIGSHTVSHPHLTRLTDGELRRELVESREHLEDRLHQPCRLLAFPFGEEDARVRAAARAAGYDLAYALDSAHRPRDRFALPRVDVYRPDHDLRFLLKALATDRPAAMLLKRFRKTAATAATRASPMS
jgi:peptidoglycan/xylan/chitin deacetylase (PgdA/CDA1 family)